MSFAAWRFTCLLLSISFSVFGTQQTQAQLSEYDAKNRAASLSNQAIQLINDNKLDAAEFKLAEASRLDSGNASILNNYGTVLLKLGKVEDARKVLEKAVQLNPGFDLVYQNLGLVYENLGDLQSAKKNLLKFAELTSNEVQADKMKEHVAMIDKNLARGIQAAAANSSDYFAAEHKMYRWPKQRMPLRVFVQSGKGVEGYKESYGEALNNAIQSWSQALDGLLSFQTWDKSEGADIEITWSHDFKNALTKAEGGDCKFSMNGDGMEHANISLLTVDPSPTDKLNDARVSWVALHEIGHALGFNSHSNNPSDVLYFAAPLKNTMPSLSSRDIQTFRRMYSEKLPDTWLSLNGEAVKLMKEGKSSDALEKLNAALKLKPDAKAVKANLILLESILSTNLLNEEKYTEAEPHLQRALDLCSETRDSKLQGLLEKYAVLLEKTERKSQVEGMLKRYATSAPLPVQTIAK